MGWLDEQIRLRKQNDDRVFAESLKRAAGTVLGKPYETAHDDRLLASSALEKILRFYHLKPQEVPEEIGSLEEQMEYLLHPRGVMYRKVELRAGWYKDAVGAYLGFRQEDHAPVALIPAGMFGYRCYDIAGETSWRFSRKTEGRIRKEAYCFYRPFPQKKLNIRALLLYMLGSLQVYDFLLIIGVSLLASMVGLLLPRLTNILYGSVLDSADVTLLAAIAVFMISAGASRLIITAAGTLITGRLETRLDLNVQSSAMMRVLSLPPAFFHEYNSGELSSRMQSVNTLCSALVNTVFSAGLTSLTSLVYITQIFRYTPMLVVPSLVIILLTLVISVLTIFLEMKRQRSIMEQDAKTTGLSFALVSGVQKIRLAGAEKRMFAHWAKQYNKEAELLYNPPLFLKVNGVLTQGVTLIGTIVLYGIALSGAVAMKDYMSFNAAYGALGGAFGALASVATVFARIEPVLEMARPILEAEPETAEEKKVLTTLSGSIEMQNVTFRYVEGGPKIIDNLSLYIHSGEYVAIAGPSGCGKSTLVRLLLGFEKPEQGSIFYDRRSIDQIDLKSLRQRIGTVMQNGGLFNDSIYANIALSAPSLTMDEAWEAAEMACIADDIRDMPMGMFTMIQEGQGGVSGGQKQRLMIARALALKPSVLIFDEATSALDNITQKKVTEALDALSCTRLVIAHRLSTIRSCSRILYMEEGRILEEGTYDELMEKKGLFADMVARQQL